MNKYTWIGLGVIIIIGIIVWQSNRQESEVPVPLDETVIEAPALDEAGNPISGVYEDFSEDKFAYAADKSTVLFFAASWCPSCRALDRDITGNLENIPEDVALLKVDYDTRDDLKARYEVTTQHTLVQVDANGDMIAKWSGGSTLESVLSEIQ
jgi:thioredoxin 1